MLVRTYKIGGNIAQLLPVLIMFFNRVVVDEPSVLFSDAVGIHKKMLHLTPK